MSNTTNKFSPEVRARAVRMVLDRASEQPPVQCAETGRSLALRLHLCRDLDRLRLRIIDACARRIVLEHALHDDRSIAAGSCTTAPGAAKADSNGRRNTRRLEVAMNVVRRRSARSGRAPLPSPGRPSVAGRNEQNRFWRAIAAGQSSEEAALEAGLLQPVGHRFGGGSLRPTKNHSRR
jgi:hypothetical protein